MSTRVLVMRRGRACDSKIRMKEPGDGVMMFTAGELRAQLLSRKVTERERGK